MLLGIGKAHFVQTHKDFGVFLKINHISQHACFCSCPSQGNVFNSSGLGSFEWRNSVFAKWMEINEALLWGLRIFIVWISKPVILHVLIEEEAMLLAVFYCCICSALLYFLCHSHSFNLSLGCLWPFLLSYVTVLRSCRLSQFYPLT